MTDPTAMFPTHIRDVESNLTLKFSQTGYPYLPAYPIHVGLVGQDPISVLANPGVHVLAHTRTDLSSMQEFLDGFPDGMFTDYLKDPPQGGQGAQVIKVCGQLCYYSMTDKRTKNKDIQKYLDHIKDSRHGSVAEHATTTILFYGIDRAVTHEMVRHRAGMSPSQVSQRYVDGSALRFCLRPEFLGHPDLIQGALHTMQEAAKTYDSRAAMLTQALAPALVGLSKTDARKRVNQAARECLPNCTEAPIAMTGNMRAWRHFLEMRCSPYADLTIRRPGYRTFLAMKHLEPEIFSDYKVLTLDDGSYALDTEYRKVLEP